MTSLMIKQKPLPELILTKFYDKKAAMSYDQGSTNDDVI